MMGPVGVGAAVDMLVLVDAVLVDAVLVDIVLVEIEVATVDFINVEDDIVKVEILVLGMLLLAVVELTGTDTYAFRRFPPPQYSSEAPLQIVEQPFCVVSLPPGAMTDPVLKTLPQ